MEGPAKTLPHSAPASFLGSTLTFGFGSSVVMWCVWFVTHLPMLGLPGEVLGPGLLGVVALGGFAAARTTGSWVTGLLSGLVCGLVNLLLLGSKIVAQPTLADGTPAPGWEGLRPGAIVVVAGFVGACAVLGAIGGLAGAIGRKAQSTPSDPAAWVARFAMVTAISYLPLLLVGGLVTSTSSGMAVPDWPGSYGANMFLYPISLMSHPRIFLEHSHRLFGAMVGLTTLVMTLYVRAQNARRNDWLSTIGILAAFGAASVFLLSSRSPLQSPEIAFAVAIVGVAVAGAMVARSDMPGTRSWKIWSFIILGAVILQGYFGGRRVSENNLTLAVIHGVVAQLILAGAVALAAGISTTAARLRALTPEPGDRRLRIFSGALVHSLLLQLVLGAMYRHLGSPHVLWTHIAWSLVVVIMAMMVGITATGRKAQDAAQRPVHLFGWLVIAFGMLQFALGWTVWMALMSSPTHAPAPTHDVMDQVAAVPAHVALIRTAHQGNGALLLGASTALMVLCRALARTPQGAGAVAPD